MTNNLLQALDAKLDQLIAQCGQLSCENILLKQELGTAQERESDWLKERTRLIEKNELARNRVEAMISRLKSLEQEV